MLSSGEITSMKLSKIKINEIEGYDAFRGQFLCYTEQGMEGLSLTILQDENHISDDGQYSYSGQLFFETGDILKITRVQDLREILRTKDVTEYTVWEGALNMVKLKDLPTSHYLRLYANGTGEFKIYHATLETLPSNIDLTLWNEIFFDERKDRFYGTIWKKNKFFSLSFSNVFKVGQELKAFSIKSKIINDAFTVLAVGDDWISVRRVNDKKVYQYTINLDNREKFQAIIKLWN